MVIQTTIDIYKVLQYSLTLSKEDKDQPTLKNYYYPQLKIVNFYPFYKIVCGMVFHISLPFIRVLFIRVVVTGIPLTFNFDSIFMMIYG